MILYFARKNTLSLDAVILSGLLQSKAQAAKACEEVNKLYSLHSIRIIGFADMGRHLSRRGADIRITWSKRFWGNLSQQS
jgi:predicted secreted Zn-dependent protease